MTSRLFVQRWELERELRGFVAEGSDFADTGSVVIPQNDIGPSPIEAHATVLLLRERQEGYPANRYGVDRIEGYVERLALSMRGEYSIQWYGDDFFADLFHHWCQSQSGIVSATRRGFALQGMSTLRRLDYLPTSSVRGATEYDLRTSLDIEISYWRVSTHELEWVERVDVNTLDYDEVQQPAIETRIDVDIRDE